MISNLYILTIYYIIIPTSLVGYGSLFFSFNDKLKISSNYGYAGLVGLILLCIYSYFSSFFIKHSETHNLIIVAIGLISFLYFNLKRNDQNKILFLFLLIYFVGFLIFKTHDDFPYYHFKYTYYLTQMPSAIGIGNFNLGFRTPSSIFYLNSLFYLPFVKYFMFQMAAFSIFLFSNIIIFNKIIKISSIRHYNFLTFFYLLSFIFINIFFYRISEHGTDRSAQVLVLILIGEILIFINFKSLEEKVLSKLFLLTALIISLKAFYVLYMLFFIIIFIELIKRLNLKKTFLFLISNFYIYLFLILFSLILITNFFNSGCLIYPVSFTCFDQFIWSIPKTEVKELNDWYEQWSKAGAGPNFRIEDSQNYIKGFNWLSNWVQIYFFTKVSDFILSLAVLTLFILFYFAPYNQNNQIDTKRNVRSILLIIVILILEWFYNHPSLRYGGYCLLASYIFVIISIKIEKTKLDYKILKKRIVYMIIFSMLVFVGRNLNRTMKEYNQYTYNPFESAFFKVENSYFNLDKKMKELKNNFDRKCGLQITDCNIDEMYGVNKFLNSYVFYLRK